ncbi:RluA family pseudouridine synthase [bacterium]|nr:RluA family pseudouridine synthase [bacterium]
MPVVTNIAAYLFAPLEQLKPLREELYLSCKSWSLKGTILLSTEGINLFVAGSADKVDRLLGRLRLVPGLEGLTPKVSHSQEQPYTRMLVKIKKEIIAFGVTGIDPARRPAPRIAPRELEQWLDEGRPVILLDTRNDFEIALGTFRLAVPIGIEHFREFPDAAQKLARPTEDTPIVTFCTGGIRCEKAAPYLLNLGFKNVLQLDGGILRYFEECGGKHFQGECFVFDKRIGLDPELDESGHGFCHACQSILTPDEQADPKSEPGVSCPHCYRTDEEIRERHLEQRRDRLRKITDPLPGSIPEDNFRPFKIHARDDGRTILETIAHRLSQFPREEWLEQCRQGNIVDGDRLPVSAEKIVHPGERYYTRERRQVEPAVNPNVEILDEDEAIIVIDKPAPLPTHPSGRYHRNTLEWMLRQVYSPQKPRPAHRLDANTSGIVLFTRTATFARRVQPQFERGEVHKEYLARVVGHPPQDRFACDEPIAPLGGHHGARIVDPTDGQRARTEFEVIARMTDGTSLLRVKPLTGRTNQIRVHLWYLGWPIQGETMYLPGHELGEMQTAAVSNQPLCLHAWRLTITHPIQQTPRTYESRVPRWGSS